MWRVWRLCYVPACDSNYEHWLQKIWKDMESLLKKLCMSVIWWYRRWKSCRESSNPCDDKGLGCLWISWNLKMCWSMLEHKNHKTSYDVHITCGKDTEFGGGLLKTLSSILLTLAENWHLNGRKESFEDSSKNTEQFCRILLDFRQLHLVSARPRVALASHTSSSGKYLLGTGKHEACYCKT